MLMQIHLPPPQLQTHTPPDTRSIVNTHTQVPAVWSNKATEEMDHMITDHAKDG